MRITSLTICEAATIHDGLLFSLGAGITRRWAPELPAPLGIMWTLQLELELADMEREHNVHALLHSPSNAELVHIDAQVRATRPPRLEIDEAVLIPMVFDVRSAQAPEYGRYEIIIDVPSTGVRDTRLFWVLHPEEMMIPPLN